MTNFLIEIHGSWLRRQACETFKGDRVWSCSAIPASDTWGRAADTLGDGDFGKGKGDGDGVRMMTNCFRPIDRSNRGNWPAPWCLCRQRAVGRGKQIVPPGFFSVERIHPIRRIPKFIPGAPVRGRRGPGPVGIRIRCIKLFEPTIHAPIVVHHQLGVHADLGVVARAWHAMMARITGGASACLTRDI